MNNNFKIDTSDAINDFRNDLYKKLQYKHVKVSMKDAPTTDDLQKVINTLESQLATEKYINETLVAQYNDAKEQIEQLQNTIEKNIKDNMAKSFSNRIIDWFIGGIISLLVAYLCFKFGWI